MAYMPSDDQNASWSDWINPIMGAALAGGGLVGRGASSQPTESKTDARTRRQALSNAMADYDRMMSTPGGMVPEGYRKMLHGQAEEQIRSGRPGAGGSGWLEDAIQRQKNQINMDLVKTELDQANRQREYIAQLMGLARPVQNMPREAGAIEQLGGRMFGQGMDQLFGLDEESKKKKKGMPAAQQGTNPSGGMGVTSSESYGV